LAQAEEKEMTTQIQYQVNCMIEVDFETLQAVRVLCGISQNEMLRVTELTGTEAGLVHKFHDETKKQLPS